MQTTTQSPERTRISLAKAASHLAQTRLLLLRCDDEQALNIAALLSPWVALIEKLEAAQMEGC